MRFIDTVRAYTPDCEQERQDVRMMLHYAELFPDLLNRSNETAHFTASAWIVNPPHTRVLMIYHNIYNSWAWTGGHADGLDDPLAVALKEAREETGIAHIRPARENAISAEILTVKAHIKRGKYVVPHLHLNLTYLLEADDADKISIKPDENSGVRWFDPENALAVCTEPEMIPIYKKLIARTETLNATKKLLV